MQTKSPLFIRAAQVLSASLLALAATRASAAQNSDAFPTFENYIKISGTSASIGGDSAAFQSRTGQYKKAAGGIEDYRYSKELNKSSTLTLDGKALSGTEDYRIHLNLAKSDFGSIDAGYETFRTFYDGVGGFFPQNSAWMPINRVTGSNGQRIYPNLSQDLALDRGKFWTEVKFGRENTPEFKIRYTNETRNGQKDSTSWGDSDNTGQAYATLNGGLTTGTGVTAKGVYANAALRKYMPSYLDIDERHQALVGSVKHKVGNTTAEVSLIGDWTNKDNGRYVALRPGETQTNVLTVRAPGTNLFAAPAVGTAATSWQSFANQTIQSNVDTQHTTSKGINGTTVTELNDKLTLRLGAAYQDVSAGFGGYRESVANAPIVLVNTPRSVNSTRTTDTYAVQGLDGDSNVDVYTGTAALDFKATESFTASFGLKGEDETAHSNGTYRVSTASTANVPVYTWTNRAESSSTDEQSVTPVLDLRYTGIKDLALYSTVSRKLASGTEITTNAYNPDSDNNAATITFPAYFYKDVSEDNADYSIGGSWKATSAITLRAEPFVKVHSTHVSGYHSTAYTTPTAKPTLNYNDNYELDSTFWGVKFTAITKPLPVLTLTSRYIWQEGNRKVTGVIVPVSVANITFPEADSMNSTTHTLGETIDWNPTKQFYMQANANLVFNVMSTVYPMSGTIPAPTTVATRAATTTAAATPNATTGATTTVAVPTGKIIQNSDNNYFTFSLLAGVVLTKADDLQVQYNYYVADNFNPVLADYGMSYGASATESTVTLGLKHKFSPRLVGNAKAGYTDSRNDTSGGYADYHGPLAYVSLEYGL